MQTHVVLEVREEVAYLTLTPDTPGKPPTLDYPALDELADRIAEIEAAIGLRAAILRSAAEKYFCVGANINALMTLDAETITPWVERGHAVFNALAALPLPVIAQVEGFCLGGGLELALACDLLIASPAARFGQPEAALGVIPGWGGTWRLPRRVGPARAKELFFTGRTVAADEALRIGLADFVGEPEALAAYLAEFMAGLRRCSPLSVAQIKEIVDGYDVAALEAMLRAEAEASRACMASADTQARVADYLESRKRRDHG
jgi:enoyl-CoA hydratase